MVTLEGAQVNDEGDVAVDSCGQSKKQIQRRAQTYWERLKEVYIELIECRVTLENMERSAFLSFDSDIVYHIGTVLLITDAGPAIDTDIPGKCGRLTYLISKPDACAVLREQGCGGRRARPRCILLVKVGLSRCHNYIFADCIVETGLLLDVNAYVGYNLCLCICSVLGLSV